MGMWDTDDRNYNLLTLGQVGKDLEKRFMGRMGPCEVKDLRSV